MTPTQKIKHMILALASEWQNTDLPDVTAENIDELYDDADNDILLDGGYLQDAREEIRSSGVETDLACPVSRNYETASVAARALDGSWVGWTYFYGGGKHGDPQAIPWMDEAYDLAVHEEQKLVTIRTFTKA